MDWCPCYPKQKMRFAIRIIRTPDHHLHGARCLLLPTLLLLTVWTSSAAFNFARTIWWHTPRNEEIGISRSFSRGAALGGAHLVRLAERSPCLSRKVGKNMKSRLIVRRRAPKMVAAQGSEKEHADNSLVEQDSWLLLRENHAVGTWKVCNLCSKTICVANFCLGMQ